MELFFQLGIDQYSCAEGIQYIIFFKSLLLVMESNLEDGLT